MTHALRTIDTQQTLSEVLTSGGAVLCSLPTGAVSFSVDLRALRYRRQDVPSGELKTRLPSNRLSNSQTSMLLLVGHPSDPIRKRNTCSSTVQSERGMTNSSR